jgi:hypothetical protein
MSRRTRCLPRVALLILALLVVPSAWAQECRIESEPNDTPAEAVPLAPHLCLVGEMAGQDQDAYLWEVDEDAARQEWAIEIQGIPGQLTKLDIVDVTFADDGVDVTSADTLFTWGTDDGRPSTSPTFRIAPGSYVLGVSKSGGAGQYVAHLRPVEALGRGRNAYRDTTREGAHAVDGVEAQDVRWTWSLNADQAQLRWDLTLLGPIAPDLELRLTDPAGAEVGSARVGEDGRATLASLGLNAGEHTIEVAGFDGPAPFAVDAVARGRLTDGNEVEPNDDWSTANVMRFDQPFEGAGPGRDRILVEVGDRQAGRAWDLVVEGGGERLGVELFDAQRRKLQERRGTGGVLRGLVFDEGEIGIEVSAEGAYTLRFEAAAPPEQGYEVEPNDVLFAASPLSDELTLRGSLWPQDLDLLSFDVEGEGGLYRVQALGEGVDVLDVVDANGRRVARATGDRRLRLDNVALLPGSYAVRLDGDEGDYAVRALRVGPIPPPPEPDPDEATADLSGPDDADPEPEPTPDEPDDQALAEPAPPPPDPGPPPPPGIVELEPNDAAVESRVLRPGRIYVGKLASDDDRDFYRFTLAADRYVRIEWLPAEDGAVGFDTTRAARAESEAVGRPAVLEARLLAGDYEVRGWAETPSDGWYRLRLTLLDPLALPDDVEPNDTRPTAPLLPADLELEGSLGRSFDGDDVFRLPTFASDTDVRIEGEIEAIRRAWLADPETSFELQRAEDGSYVGTVPAETTTFAWLRGQGAYVARFVFDAPVDPDQLRRPTGEDGVRLELASDVEALAAYRQEGQRVDATIRVTNEAEAARTVAFDAAVSQWPIQVAVPEPVTLAAGERTELPLRIDLPNDLRDDQDLTVTVGAQSDGGLATAQLAFAPICEAPPSSPSTYYAVPDALLGHLNVASSSLGTTVVEGEDARGYEAIDGIASPSTGAYRLPGEAIVLDLPGDEPIRLTGTLLNPQSRQILRQLRTFELSTSVDGETFESVLEGELAAARLEQGFVFDRPVEARFVRLRFLDDQNPGDQGQTISLGEWKVLSDDRSLVDGADLADVRNGGVMVWSDPLVGPNVVLAGNDGRASLDGRRFEEATFVIGFHHGRAARIERLVWVDGDRAVGAHAFQVARVEASMGGPTGPWTELGEWELARSVPGSVGLELDAPVWARYVRVTASGHDPERSSVYAPAEIRVHEAPETDDYRTILAEWGYARSVGPFEASRGVAAAPDRVADDGSDDVLGGATPLADGDGLQADVLVGEDEDWYRIDVPDGANAITLDLGGDVSAVRYRLVDAQERPVTYDLAETASGVRLTAFVDPGSYYLHVEEPKRSVVFSWDTSGSVRPYEPITYAAVSSFARDVDPDREFVQMLAFDTPSPKWLLPYWSGDPNATSRALVDFDRSTADSSNAELAVSTAVGALGQREGTRALLVITDHESGGYDLTRDLWRSIEAVGPRVFTFEVSTAGSGITQDRMQAYAAANDGHYAYARNVGDFDAGFRRASCHLRRPKAYTVAVEVAYREPPGPGTLTVRRGEGATLPGVEVIFDASGSMGASLPSGEPKIDAAKGVLRDLVREILPEGVPFALRAFGHLTPQSCESRLEVGLAPLVREEALAAIDEIQPKLLSQTPLADALLQVGSDLGDAPPGSSVVVITDGEESCGGDPAAAVDELRSQGLDVQVSIVSLGVEDESTRASFEALADRAGGSYAPADDLSSLRSAVEAAMNPPFEVLDAAGEVVARGRIDGEPIEIPMGRYTVRVPGSPPELIRDVRVPGDSAVQVTLETP